MGNHKKNKLSLSNSIDYKRMFGTSSSNSSESYTEKILNFKCNCGSNYKKNIKKYSSSSSSSLLSSKSNKNKFEKKESSEKKSRRMGLFKIFYYILLLVISIIIVQLITKKINILDKLWKNLLLLRDQVKLRLTK